ncbi:proteasome subunit beta type-7 isoform X2 [Calypte anna]|uniref:proteasome subunit beta type-7 isoform X2 n=1 Tax=Calypte anna TaxID=9244 RepID=UPI0011C3E690|nr:proteasome subunit beta type-7 isoform X2 [Calypte anna]
MAAVSVLQAPSGGFSFDNCARNSLLEAELVQKGQRLPAARKTGTTIAGVIFKDGVVLGADTRATEGMVVADKNCSKIHFISPNIYCCGAGTAADTDMTTQLISSNLELHSLSTGRLPRVVTANRMLKQMLFRYQGYIGAALVLGGVDVTGPHLYSIYPHGSTDKLPYVTMGSGSLAAMAVFEDKYKLDMELQCNPKDLFALSDYFLKYWSWAVMLHGAAFEIHPSPELQRDPVQVWGRVCISDTFPSIPFTDFIGVRYDYRPVVMF